MCGVLVKKAFKVYVWGGGEESI